MYYLDRKIIEPFINEILMVAHQFRELEDFHWRSRIKVRLQWSNLHNSGFTDFGSFQESELHAQEEKICELIDRFAESYEATQTKD